MQYTTPYSLSLVCFSPPSPLDYLCVCTLPHRATTHCNTAMHYITFALPHLLLYPPPSATTCVFVHCCSTPQHTATHCNTLHHIRSSSFASLSPFPRDYLCDCTLLQHTTTYCNTAIHYITFALPRLLLPLSPREYECVCTSLQHTTTYRNTQQYTTSYSLSLVCSSPPPPLPSHCPPLSLPHIFARFFVQSLAPCHHSRR